MTYYILDENNIPKALPDVSEWAQWMQSHNRKVALTEITPRIFVSTIFLSIDHNFPSINECDEKPILWETMIFGLDNDEYQERYSSHKDALIGHERAVEYARRRI